MAKFVYFFSPGRADGDPRRKDILGGKGASLAAMSQAGLPVPPGFTLSTECCRLFLQAGRRWPEGLEQEICAALERLERCTGRRFGDREKPLLVSVRSGAAVSMPGMMDTILNCGLAGWMSQARQDAQAFWRVYNQFVMMFGRTTGGIPAGEFEAVRRELARDAGHKTGPLPADGIEELCRRYQQLYSARTGRQFPQDPWTALVECIEMVFRSWNNERAVAYRREHDIRGLSGTAVTVQAMFPSEVSGVAFTANPNDPAAGELVIESSYGLGSAVVSGDVHPDNFILDRRSLSIRRSLIGHKSQVVPALDDDARRDPEAPSLSPERLGELAGICLEVEKFFGRPMDIEWGWAGGKFALLQARPITSLAQTEAYAQLLQSTRAHLRSLLEAGRGPWVMHNLGETLPHPTPLTWSVLGAFMTGSGGFGRMYRQAGFEPSPAVCRHGFLELIGGKVHMDVTLAPEMFLAGYPFKYDLELLARSPQAGQSPPTLPGGSLRARLKAARKVRAVKGRLSALAGALDRQLAEKIIPELVAWCRQEKRRDLASLSAEELVELWRRRRRRVLDEFAPWSLLASLVGGMALEQLKTFLGENFWDQDADGLAAALSVAPVADKTMLANAGLYAVAHGRRTLENWLAEFGHRSADEFDLASPRWRERPEKVQALADRLKGGADPMALVETRFEHMRSQCRQLRAKLGRPDRREFDRRLALLRRYIPFREDGKFYLMLGYDLLRDLAVEAGGRLGLEEEVFLLTAEELFDALREGAAPRELLARRKAQRRAEARLTLPALLDAGALEALGQPPRRETAGSYAAFALSTGSATGPAWVVRSPEDAGALEGGYILVCASTDPAWTPLFVNAAGLVLECGGTLSHGAIVARELGIPAVVLPQATALFADGETLTVDGHHGAVSRAGGAAGVPLAPDSGLGVPRGGSPEPPRHAGETPATPTTTGGTPVLPPPGRRERRAGRVRNICLLVWAAYLLAAFLLPQDWLYRPSFAVLDALLWPMVPALGRAATVIVLAGLLAGLTMLGQRCLTDNPRLRQAKRGAHLLSRQAAGLATDSPRRRALVRQTAAVQGRLLGAALVPLGILLGPMVMTFLWLPARVAPEAFSAPAGASVSVVATVDSDFDGPVTCAVDSPLELDGASPASRTLPPIRRTLEKLLAQWSWPTTLPAPGLDLPLASRQSPRRSREDLQAYVDAGVPPQGVAWKVRAPEHAVGGFGLTVRPGQAAPSRAQIVLGQDRPPGWTDFVGDGRLIKSVQVVYPPPEQKPCFWRPLAFVGVGYDPGWLLTYLVAYIPVMLLLRWLLRIP